MKQKKWFNNWLVSLYEDRLEIDLPNGNVDPFCKNPLVLKFDDKDDFKYKKLYDILISCFHEIQIKNGGYKK